jgi:hypothetical protein
MPSSKRTRGLNRRALIFGVMAVLVMSVVPLASTNASSATELKGTGSYTCSVVGTVTFSPPWITGGTGLVTASVALTGPPTTSHCGWVTKGNRLPTSVRVTGQLTFPNGNCSTTIVGFTKNTLKVTYTPVVTPSTFTFESGRSGISMAAIGGVGTVTGSYPRPLRFSPSIAHTPARLTGSCPTGVTKMSWSQSFNPPNVLQLVGF